MEVIFEGTCVKNTTSVAREILKKRNLGAIYKVLSILHQGLSYSLVAVKDHHLPTEETEAENVSMLLCKLQTDKIPSILLSMQ